jgi:hypothetical protein
MKKITLLMVCFLTTIITNAQWNSDTATNTLVANSVVDDAGSLSTSNGNTYVVFWHPVAAPTNYELRLQKLDALGNKQFGNDGVLVSNTIPMSTSTAQWFISSDSDENIYIGVTGTSNEGGYAFKLNSDGVNQWTNDGINLGGIGYVVRVLPLSSGNVIISWMDGSYNGHLQKYDSSGSPIWTNDVQLGNGKIPAQSLELSDGGFVNIYHQRLGSYGINTKMYAQRYDSDGNAQWSTPTQLFADGNNTAFNSNYSSVQDGDVIYISYKLAHNNRFDTYLQRINPDGTLPWGITGMDFDTNQTNYEQENQVAYSPGSENIWVLCRYTDSSQGNVGIYIQKFDKITGNRLFTDNAKMLYAISNPSASPAGNFRVINDQPLFLTSEGNNLNINLLDENGDFVWSEESKPIATFNASKGRVNLNLISNSELVATFVEDKGSGSQIFAQNFTDTALSVEEFSSTTTLQFINPIQNKLRLKSNQTITSIEIYNTLGQLINRTKNNSSELTVNAQNWNSGMYLAIVTTINGNQQSIKILKK